VGRSGCDGCPRVVSCLSAGGRIHALTATVCDYDNTRGGRHWVLGYVLQTLHRLAGPYRPWVLGQGETEFFWLSGPTWAMRCSSVGKLIIN
jgi:hypothetical protein